jgi:polygalacturonase
MASRSRSMIRNFNLLLVALAWPLFPLACGGAVAAPPPVAAGRLYDVRAYGAKGDTATLDTDAINRAIDAAAAAGGGTVYFGPGTYSAFSIHLKSNVTLYLDQGVTLLAANPAERAGKGYDPAEPGPSNDFQDYGHSHWHNSLIWGVDIHDVAIQGVGRIDGNGLKRGINRDTPGVGNKAIALKNVRNVLLRDVTIYRGGHFGVLATGVDNFTIDNVTIDTNRDGIDVDDCRNVRISNVTVNSPFDDAIVLKTTYALGALRATENVTITNSMVSGFAVGSVLDGTYRPFADGRPNRDGPTGRVKLGTESNGPFRNITISNIVFDNSRGLALETVDGSQIEDVAITNITMRHVATAPLLLRLGARMRGPDGLPVGSLKRVTISNLTAWDVDPRYASVISGVPGHDIEDVHLSNIRLHYRGGMTIDQVVQNPETLARTRPADDTLRQKDKYFLPEQAKVYPEPSMFGLVPAYGFYIRHVNGLHMDDVQVAFDAKDTRPAFVLQDARDAEFINLRATKTPGVPTFVLRNVEDFRVSNSRPVADKKVQKAANQSF